MSELGDALTQLDQENLIYEIATRARTAKQLAKAYEVSIEALKEFLEENKEAIQTTKEIVESTEDQEGITVQELDALWISKKVERLNRYQAIADDLFTEAKQGSRDATVLRELRFFMTAAANELGQLLHRGAGESGSDSLSVDIGGVDINQLR